MKEENKNKLEENNKDVYLSSERNSSKRRVLEINLDQIIVKNLNNKIIACVSSKNKTSRKINFGDAEIQNNIQTLSNEDYDKKEKEKDDDKKINREDDINIIFPSQRSNCPIINNFKKLNLPKLEIKINLDQV